MFPHLGALPDYVIDPGQATKFPRKIASLFFSTPLSETLTYGAASLVTNAWSLS